MSPFPGWLLEMGTITQGIQPAVGRLEEGEAGSRSRAASEQMVTRRHLEPQPHTKQPVALAADEHGSEPSVHQAERSLKSVEWRPLPLKGTSSSGGADSDSSSPQLDLKSRMQKATGHLPQAPGHTPEQTKLQAGSCRRESRAEPDGGWARLLGSSLRPARPRSLPQALKDVPQPLAFSGAQREAAEASAAASAGIGVVSEASILYMKASYPFPPLSGRGEGKHPAALGLTPGTPPLSHRPSGHCRPVGLTADVPDGHSKRGSTSGTGVLFLDQQENDLDRRGKLDPACSADTDSWRPGHRWR